MPAFSDFTDLKTLPPANGSTDWGPSFNSLLASGARIYVPEGVYTIDTPIRVGDAFGGQSVHIIGAGIGKSVLRARVGNQAIIGLDTTRLPPSNLTIEHLSFDQTGGLPGVSGLSFEAPAANRFTLPILRNLAFAGLSKAIALTYCANTYMDTIFATHCDDGIVVRQCADTNMSNIEVQLGNGIGFSLSGFNDDSANDEGTRMVNCSTNGQSIGLKLWYQNIGDVSACSFTTCRVGCLIANHCTNWRFSACEFAGGTFPGGVRGGAAVNMDVGCSMFQFSGCTAFVSTFGFILQGSQHIVSGCTAAVNLEPDVYLGNASGCVVTGNSLYSTTSVYSVNESAPGPAVGSSDYNVISCNVGKKLFAASGAHTISNNNIIIP